MSKQTQQQKPQPAAVPPPAQSTPHAVSGRYVRLERGGRNGALVRCEAVTLQAGHVVMVEELHPLDAAAISMEYAQRELWAGVTGRKA